MSSGQAQATTSGAVLTVDQASNKAILNWQDFNIGRDAKVIFNQPGSTASALNRIWQADPSVIQGALKANGQIFLINQNGILFDQGAQINVGSLVGSTLNITDELFQQGFLSAIKDNTPVLSFEAFLGPDGTVLSGSIVVNDGARLSADQSSNGRIMLFGRSVRNNGLITAPDGQVMLAAGEKVYLLASQDPNLRGLFVEVGNASVSAPDASSEAAGTASNLPLGKIIAERGNVSLAGLAVNQQGRISATTAVNANGSIRLQARDTPTSVELDNGVPRAFGGTQRGGALVLSKDSITEITPELTSKATIDSNAVFNRSSVLLAGRTILHQGQIVAPGGSVRLDAQDATGGLSRIFLAEGSSIDVAGTTSTLLPMSRNALEVELRGDELKDSPVQRDGFLRGKKVTIDVSRGTSIGDVSKQIAAIQRGVGEKSAVGGSISISSINEVLVERGSLMDVSGGVVSYEGGFLNTTKLVDADGRVHDISTASPLRTYIGFAGSYVEDHPVWRTETSFSAQATGQFVAGFSEGRDAGEIAITTPVLRLDGVLRGAAAPGINQRESGKLPLAGKLSIGANVATLAPGALSFANSKPLIALDFSAPALTERGWTLTPEQLTSGGLGRFDFFAEGAIALPADVALRLPAGGELALTGESIDLQGSIAAPGGSVALTSTVLGSDRGGDIRVAASASISTRGLWVNDSPLLPDHRGNDPVLISGGSISMRSWGNLLLGDIDAGGQLLPTLLDVSGGGWVDQKGQLRKGNGGSIALEVRQGNAAADPGVLRLGAAIRALAPGRGGRLSISAGEILIRDGSAARSAQGDLILRNEDLAATTQFIAPSWLFNTLGFSAYELTDTRRGLTLAENTALTLAAPYLALDSTFSARQTGSDISTFSRIESDALLRAPTNLTLRHNFVARPDAASFVMQLGAGSRIDADPKASVSLISNSAMFVDAAIRAPGGSISLSLPAAREAQYGYNPRGAIWLGTGAHLDVAGTFVPTPNATGLRTGDVLPGGSIALTADEGYVVTEPGSVIDVSGGTAQVNLPRASPGSVMVGGRAGQLSITAAEGMLLASELRGSAGAGQAGATLTLRVTGAGRLRNTLEVLLLDPFPLGERVVRVTPEPLTFPEELQFGDNIDLKLDNGIANIPATSLAGGFSQTVLRADNAIALGEGVVLQQARSIVLDAPNLDLAPGAARLQAPYVALGHNASSRELAAITPVVSAGEGALRIEADLIDLIGTLGLRGVGQLELESRGDIRLRGVRSPSLVLDDAGKTDRDELRGALLALADITLRAERIYPTSASRYSIKTDTGRIITQKNTNNVVSRNILSAGGELTLTAPTIQHEGALLAPFGAINLAASESLTLAPGSITSTANLAGSAVPYGRTQNATDWVLDLGLLSRSLSAPPQRSIALNGRRVDIQPGAVVDLSGGGDLYAYEFVPGPGGSVDTLMGSAQQFAILPSLGTDYAPYDPHYSFGSTLQPGDAVQLSGIAGLASGTYTLLPARYALLPGAYLVTPTSGFQDLQPGEVVHRLDGVPIVSGRRSVAGTDFVDSRYSGFVVEAGAAARKRTEYRDSFANAFFLAQAARREVAVPRLPRDAGSLSTFASESLGFAGDFLSAPGKDGRGALVDIAAQKLKIVAEKTTATDFVELTVSDLSNLGAESLLIGGTRSQTEELTRLSIGAQQVVVDSGDAVLRAPELLLAATDSIEVKRGSVIEASGTLGSSETKLALVDPLGGSAGALLRASAGAQASVQRSGEVDRSRGAIVVEDGAVLRAARSLLLDASSDTRALGSIALEQGGELSIGAQRISLGEVGAVSEGLVLDNSQLSALAGLRRLHLRSYSSIDFWGDTRLSGEELTLDAGALLGIANAGKTATITGGRQVVLQNTAAPATAAISDGSGTLTIDARQIVLGEGAKRVEGFDQLALTASSEILLQAAGDLTTPAAIKLAAHRIGGLSAAQHSMRSDAALEIVGLARPDGYVETPGLGARLSFSATSVRSSGWIDAPGGFIELRAQGPGGLLQLAADSRTSAAGATRGFDNVPAHLDAGKVLLAAAQGDVIVEAGAVVDVSARGDRAAGVLEVSAIGGNALLQGNLLGTAATAQRSGRFSLDAKSISGATVSDLGELSALLNAGQFERSRALRLREGDVLVSAGENRELRAQHVSIVADAGSIDVAGVIRAQARNGGRIDLAARDDVRLQSGAVLDASGLATHQQAGHISLATTTGEIALESGSTVNLTGTRKAGELWLRAPRTRFASATEDNEVAVSRLAADVAGAERIVIEALHVYEAVNTSEVATWRADTDAYMVNAEAILTRIGRSATPTVLRPGIEVRSDTDLTVSSNWDLSGWRYADQPGVLTLRAAGNLLLGVPTPTRPNQRPVIQAVLNDGFAGTSVDSALLSTSSWSYRLTAGADLSGADPLALLPLADLAEGSGNVSVAAGRVVRTGTGSIDIAAGRDFVLGQPTSGINQSTAAVYTAGRATSNDDFAVLAEFPLPTNANYPTAGGNVSILAQQDVQGAITHQLITAWLPRRGRTNLADGSIVANNNTSWHIDYSRFQQNIGALGGGDVDIAAGRDVINLSAVVPTTGRLGGAAGSQPRSENLVVLGGGDLNVDAGRDIKSGVFYVARGEGSLRAAGSINAGRVAQDTGGGGEAQIHTVLALADGRFDVTSIGDLTLETVLNPTVVGQINTVSPLNRTFFFTYSERAAVSATSVTGDVVFNNDITSLRTSAAPITAGPRAREGILPGNTDEGLAFAVYAPSLTAQALEGSVKSFNQRMDLFPAKQSTLLVLAGKDIDFSAAGAAIKMQDVDPALLPSALSIPSGGGPLTFNPTATRLNSSGAQSHADPLLHADDRELIRLVAAAGDILGSYTLPKAARLAAGRDITSLSFVGQNLSAGDVTSIFAGRDVVFPTLFVSGSAQSTGEIRLGGPGRLEVIAGRNVDLGSSTGILTQGRRENPALPEGGADITIVAGSGVPSDFADFIAKYLDTNAQPALADYKKPSELAEAARELLKFETQDAAEQQRIESLSDEDAVAALRQTWLRASGKQLLAYMRTLTGDAGLNDAQALEQFKALSAEQQRPLVLDVYYDRLREAGRGFAKVGESAYQSGFEAVSTLFPGDSYAGDVTLLLSQIKTQGGGDINLLVPGGKVNAGQTTAAGGAGGGKSAADLGLIVEDLGDIRAFVDGNFDVNESRVVTLRGGSILMWSSEGDIDAGRGAKTAAAAPAPLLLIDSDGGTTFRVTSFSGSGIRSFLLEEGITPGDVDLIAPAGEVNAGDAGIGAAGNLNIAALRVVGADNIQVGGLSSGVPVADVGGIGAGLTGLSNVGSEASKAAEQATQQAVSSSSQADALSKTVLPSFITVEVLEDEDVEEQARKRRESQR